MRKFQKVLACIMAVALVATGCFGGSTDTKAPTEPVKTKAAGKAKAQTASDEAAKEENPVLVIYTIRNEALNNAMIPEFEKDMGIRVEVVVAGTDELLKRTQSEKDNPLGDTFWTADQTMFSVSKDLFMEHVSSEDDNMLEVFRNTTGYFTPALADLTVMIVDRGLEGDMKANGFESLLNPELKGRVALSDPVNSNSALQSLLVMPYDMGKNGDPLSDQAWDYVDQPIVNPNSKMCSSSSQVYKDVTEGECVVGLTREDSAASYVKEGAAVEVAPPEKGVILPEEPVQILKDCRHSENAEKLMDYMLSEKIQNAADPNLTVRPLRGDVKLASYMTSQSETKLFDNYDEGWIAGHRTEITNLFSKRMETSMD